MRCLNSPATLNSFELKVVETTPADARHILVVNAGDGRLARAVHEKAGGHAVVTVVTLQAGLRRFVDDFPSAGDRPWDLEWHEAQVAAHGRYDYVVIYQLHEFWRGELHELQCVLDLAKPGAEVWVSFLNALAFRVQAASIPPVQLGLACLADPIRQAAKLDLASFLDLIAKSGDAVLELWGLLDENAQQFCQQPGQAAVWEMRGIKARISTLADAFLWGAPMVGLRFRHAGGGEAAGPRVTFSPFTSVLFQALALPYPEEQAAGAVLAGAHLEIAAWRREPPEKFSAIGQLLLERAGDTGQPRRVLVVGAGWGRDVLLLKRAAPAWECVGVETNKALLSLGRELQAESGVTVIGIEPDGKLPFPDDCFDLALSFVHLSGLHQPAARHLVKEMHRVTKGPIHHVEDARGPDHSLQLKAFSLPAIYAELGADASVQSVLIDGNPNGMYTLSVAARN